MSHNMHHVFDLIQESLLGIEPLLDRTNSRFVLFPIQDADVCIIVQFVPSTS